MKINFIYKFVVVILVMITTACQKDFLNTAPTDSIGEEDAYKTSENLMTIINGMHRSLYFRFGSEYGFAQGSSGIGGMMIMMDSFGEDMVHTANGLGWHLGEVRWLTNENEQSNSLLYLYASFYKLIRNANSIIINGPKASGDPILRDRAIGQAYAYRAWCYYNLVQLFGKRYDASAIPNSQLGVPLRLDLSLTRLSRSTVENVYTQINQDLNSSLTLLAGKPRGTTGTFLSHFNENVVRGLMARVALTQERWNDAATQANLARNGITLMTNNQYINGFSGNINNEWMWGVQIQLSDQTDFFGDFGAYMSRNFNSTTIRTAPKAINSNLYNSFASTDVRRQVFDPTGNHSALGLPANFTRRPFTSQKFLAVSASDARADIPLMRGAEMFLIEAEALARSGQEATSKTVFNLFERNRNPSYTGATTTGSNYINEILRSRRFELWGEGFRFFDLKRLNSAMDRTGTNFVNSVVNGLVTVPAGDKRWVLKIPINEINASGGLVVQN